MRALALGLALWTGAAQAQAVRLAPAAPQPEAPAPGLSVRYAYPGDVQSLSEAEATEGQAEPGPPLIGFDYPDTYAGEDALTSRRAERVVAFIDGWLNFPEAGVWRVQFHSNDGLEVRIGGAEVYRHDGRHGCETLGWQTELEIPEPGWYPLEAVWFQRQGTSCLLMEWSPPSGEMGWTPNDALGRTE